MTKAIRFAHLALLGVALIYGANYAIAKIVMDDQYIGPSGFILMRAVTATMLFWITFRRTGNTIPQGNDRWRLMLCGLLGVAANQTLFFEGLARTSPIHASLIMVITPLLVLLLSTIIAGRWPSSRTILGMMLAAGGTVWLILQGNGNSSSAKADWLGDLMVAGNAISYAGYLVLVQPLMKKYPAGWILKWVFFFGMIPVLFNGWSEAVLVDWSRFTTPVWLSFLYVLLFTTYLTYLFNAWALQHVAAVTVSAYIYLQPLIAALAAVLLGQDHPTWMVFFAGLLICGGVWMASKSPVLVEK